MRRADLAGAANLELVPGGGAAAPGGREAAQGAGAAHRTRLWWTGRPLDRTRTSHLQRLDLTVAA